MTDTEAGPSTWATEDFDVFLNHRGPDVKETFVADLEEALRIVKFRPFLDRLSLIKGNPAHEFIYQALDMAKVHVAVVSRGYAESMYCLDELVAMVRSGKPVIPVFYDVEPMDLRRVESGLFKEAFEKHKSRHTKEKLKDWTNALGWLANITGFCLAHYGGDETRLKDEVVKAVEYNSGARSGAENRRFGLDKSKSKVVQKLRRDGVVGLYGVGGIGKTTLATAVYDYLALDFQHRSFLSDVISSDAHALQNQIVRDLTGVEKKVSTHEEYQIQFHQFKDLKVLIVVDNIDNERQFRDIIPDLSLLSKDSRVIVTSRDRGLLSNVLISTDMAESVLHEVEGLEFDESQQLFNFKALVTDSTHSVFKVLAVKVADGCRGHPMALEIAGGFLRNKKNVEKDRVYWEEIASTATRNDTLQSILQISYDKGLDYCQKTMFLDISCLLVGELNEVALEIWASCESCVCGIRPGVHSSLADLIDKCLVKLDTDGRLRMHDVIRDMGRQIVEDSVFIGGLKKWDRTHFWDPAVADKVLRAKEGSESVRGLSRARRDRVLGDTSIPTYEAEAFSGMGQLHLLILDGCLVSGDFSKWSRELRLLRWKFFPLSELPWQLDLAETAVLDLTGSTELTRLWRNETLLKTKINLRRLVLNNCIALEELPQDIGKRLSTLKVLELGRCIKLESLPDSIGEMKDLEHLILRGCQKLRFIPRTIGRLKKLKHLDLTGCLSLETLPDTILNLAELEKLIVVGCGKLEEMPMDFRKLANLKVLQLHSDKELQMVLYLGGLKVVEILHLRLAKLKTLPADLGQLTGLTEMSLEGCTELASLPDDVGTLQLLKTLDLSSCHSLESLPDSLGTLTALTTLVLQCNSSITEVPESLSGLISLDRLQMNRCPELRTVKALPRSLRHLDLANCPKLVHLPSIEGFRSLSTLILCNCLQLKEIQGLDTLTALEAVNVTGCISMPLGVQLQHNRAMSSCCLSGSNVAVKYDNDWSQSEPEQQLISYYNDEIGFVDNGLVQEVYAVEYCHKVCMEATVEGKNECVAVVICCVTHDQGWSSFEWEQRGHYSSECFLDAWIVRNGQEIYRSRTLIKLKHADCRDQVYLCTLRRTHPLVRGLKQGDMIRVAARSDFPKWAIFVKRGAICVVHGDGEDQVISVNSKLLDVQQSREKKAEFAGLVLADNPNCPEGRIVPSQVIEPVLEPGSFYVVPRWFRHAFDPFWMFPSAGQGVVSFVAHSVDDVEVQNISICISPERRQAVPRYEICIGTGLSWIRRHLLHSDPDSDQYGVVRFLGLVKPLERNQLWVSIDKKNRELRVGRGEAHEDVFLEYQDHDFFSDVQYISFSTYDSPIVFSDVTVMELPE